MRLVRYWRQGFRSRRDQAQRPTWRQLWSWLPAWHSSLTPGRGSLPDERPWITFGAFEFLESRSLAGARVFEWGSGGSSVYFARRAMSVVSVEHDAAWFERVRAAIDDRPFTNWQGFLCPAQLQTAPLPTAPLPTAPLPTAPLPTAPLPTAPLPTAPLPIGSPPNSPADWDGYVSDADEYRQCHFRAYASRIDSFADDSFDVVLIDGRARPSCLKHALPKVRPGGCLIWDNSEREYYFPAMNRVPDTTFQRFDFRGPGPYVADFWRTTVWVRREPLATRAA